MDEVLNNREPQRGTFPASVGGLDPVEVAAFSTR
jgi:hypothetical protein